MKPTKFLILLISVILLASIISLVLFNTVQYLKYLLLIVSLLSLIDYLLLRRFHKLKVSRHVASVMALHQQSEVLLSFSNESDQKIKILIYDGVPEHIETVDDFPQLLVVPTHSTSLLKYQVLPDKRGDFIFNNCSTRLFGLFGLLTKNISFSITDKIKVFPDYVPVIEYAMLKTNMRTNLMGIHSVNKRGDGIDFKELRAYREGDSLRQIDWKSTSRQNRTISREYQVERDQSFIFLLDCGHRMNSLEDSLTHFDHVLNAMLLTSYIALKQGDAVGYVAFGGEKLKWKTPAKGMGCFNRLLEDVYNIQPTHKATDFLSMAEILPTLHRKSATVILLTNIRDNDSIEILPAVKYLSRYYQIIVASIIESTVENEIKKLPDSFDDALTKSATIQYIKSRQKVINKIKSNNLRLIDIPAKQLPVALANEYLAFKGK